MTGFETETDAPLCARHGTPKVRVTNRSTTRGWAWRCPTCHREAARRYAGTTVKYDPNVTPLCPHGHGPKAKTLSRRSPRGFAWYCRECHRAVNEKARRAKGVKPHTHAALICPIHGTPKYKQPRRTCAQGWVWRCRECRREAKRRYRAANIEKVREAGRNRMRRVHGAVPRNSPEYIEKISGANRYNWTGDDASYGVVHMWLKKHYPKTGVCEVCGADDRPTDYAFLGEPGGFARDRSRYREECKPCHRRRDKFDAKVRSYGIRVVRG